MKLKSILYEEGNPLTMVSKGPAQQPGSSSVISYTAPNFALFVNEEGNTPDLTLVNVPALLRYLTPGNVHDPLPLYDIIAGYISLRDSGNECLTAMQVELVAGSPKYPGAGMTMYALASDHFSTPITSDRHMSTSKQGQQTWAKIESDTANWQRGGARSTTTGRLLTTVRMTGRMLILGTIIAVRQVRQHQIRRRLCQRQTGIMSTSLGRIHTVRSALDKDQGLHRLLTTVQSQTSMETSRMCL